MASHPADSIVHLVVEPTVVTYGAIVGTQTLFADVTDVELTVFQIAAVNDVVQLLQVQDPSVAYDDSKGTIIAFTGRPGSALTVDPLPQPRDYFAWDVFGVPIVGSNQAQWAAFPGVAFMNLQLMPPPILSGTKPDGGACHVPLPVPPLRPDHISYVGLDCG